MADTSGPGNLLFQGMQSAGQGIGQGIQQYAQYKQMAAQATAKFEAAVRANPDMLKALESENGGVPDTISSAYNALKSGGAVPFPKAAALAQFAESYTGNKNAMVQQQLAQAQAGQASSESALNTARATQINRQMQYLQSIMGGQQPGAPSGQAMQQFAQPVGGTGQPAPQQPPSIIQQPPKPVMITDPQIQSMLPQALRMTLGDPDKAATLLQQQVDALNKQQQGAYDKQTAVTKPTGNLYFKRIDYKDGMPQSDVYSPEIMNGPGTISQSLTAGSQEIILPHGQKPTAPVVAMGTGKPDDETTGAGYNTNDPQWQSEVADTYQKAASSSVSLGNAKALMDAAQAYTAGNISQFNAIRGDPKYAKIFSVFNGTNPAAAFKIALAANTQSVLNEIRGPNGSVGGRILQNEYDNTSKVLADATMDNPTIMAAARNNYTLADRRNNIDQAVAKFREHEPMGTATARAIKMFGLDAPNMQTGLGAMGGASAQAVAPPPPGMVRMKSPTGGTGFVPIGNAKAAAAAGYTPVQ